MVILSFSCQPGKSIHRLKKTTLSSYTRKGPVEHRHKNLSSRRMLTQKALYQDSEFLQ